MVLKLVGIGAPKCATTWTYRVLDAHPGLHFPAKKEVNFWSNPSGRDLQWYSATMAEHDPDRWCGEISVSYVGLSRSRIQALHRYAPDVRLLLNVRHPVDRAWSHARMRLREQGLDPTRMSDGELFPFVFAGVNVERGDYASALDRWLSVFPADQLLVTRFDDVVRRPDWVIRQLCGHLGVDTPATLLRRFGTPHSPKRSSVAATRPLPAGFREMLTRLYAVSTERLRDHYGIDYTGPSAQA